MERMYTGYLFDRRKVQSFEQLFKVIRSTKPKVVQNLGDCNLGNGCEYLYFIHDQSVASVDIFTPIKPGLRLHTSLALPGCGLVYLSSGSKDDACSEFLNFLKVDYTTVTENLGETIYASLVRDDNGYVGIITQIPTNTSLPISEAMAAIKKGEAYIERVWWGIFMVNYTEDDANLYLFEFKSSSKMGGGLDSKITIRHNYE